MQRVLVIDDSAVTIQLICDALTTAGLEVEAASDLATLDQRLAGKAFDLVLVDVNMPEMYGDDVVEFLRAQRKLTAKLFLYSDLPEAELAQKAQNVAADGYITKGSGLDGAVDAVREALGLSHGQRRRRVLVVDDSPSTAHLLEVELQGKGHEVLTATSVDAATKIILKKKTRPDLVLLDVRMPGVDGEQFCRFIKGNSLFSGIQVILCSGEDDAVLKRIVKEAGADGFIRKDTLIAKEILELINDD